MDNDKFIAAYEESRNGTEHFYFNKLMPKFFYSDGVKECAETGCYWLLMRMGTEVLGVFKQRKEYLAIVTVAVKDNKAVITTTFEEEDPNPFIMTVDLTDMPEGEWNFYIYNEGPEFGFRCILPSEY